MPYIDQTSRPPAGVPSERVAERKGENAFRALHYNIRAGFRVATFQSIDAAAFRIRADQAVLLLIVGYAIFEIGQYLATEPPRIFDAGGLPILAAHALGVVFVAFLIARSRGADEPVTPVLVVIEASFLLPSIALMASDHVDTEFDTLAGNLTVLLILLSLVAWLLAVLYRSVRVLYGAGFVRNASLAAFYIVVLGAWSWVLPDHEIWTSGAGIREATDVGELAAVPYDASIDVERVFYSQPELVDAATERLAPQRPGVIDLYLIGFAATGRQNVFRNEVETIEQKFASQFDTANRSVALVNSPDTVETLPIASGTNLWWTLLDVAEVMDLEEDILFLYLTSHGSPEGWFAVDFWPLDLNDVHASELRTMLDDAGINWRVVVVSACYSGAFIDALRDERTLVITASHSDRTSFGCANDRDFTYFGEAYFDHALGRENDFVAAFEIAREWVTEKEEAEELTPSLPQMHVGSEIAERLGLFAAQLEKRQSAQAAPPN